MSELEKEEVREAFAILTVNEWNRIRNTRILSAEEEWEMFKSAVMTCAATSQQGCVGTKVQERKSEEVPGGMKR